MFECRLVNMCVYIYVCPWMRDECVRSRLVSSMAFEWHIMTALDQERSAVTAGKRLVCSGACVELWTRC